MSNGLVIKKVGKSEPVQVLEMEQVFVPLKCQNEKYECSLPPEETQQFCIKHILQDPTAPYKQCSFLFSNGKQCTQAKFAEERKDPKWVNSRTFCDKQIKFISFSSYTTFCTEHSRLSQLNKTKSTVGSFKQIDSTETLVNSLAHHVMIDKVKPQSTTKLNPFDDDEEIDVVTPTVDPFTDINAFEVNNRGKTILDYASDSSSDEDTPTTLVNTWRSHELDNSDDESVDSSDEDLLKHAGIYTVDEVVTVSKQKMQRLQTLYIDQFHRLQYVLREKRRVYLQDLKKEKDSLSSIHDQARDSPKERKLYNNLKAMNHYHRRYGVEALLHRQFLEKRQKQIEPALMSAPILPQQKNIPKCIFSEGGVKCNERSIPCCRYCRKHIMEDKKQILFKACAVEKSGIVCQEPVVNIFDDYACVLHTSLPTPKTYIKRKYESETEEDDCEAPMVFKKEKSLDIEMDTTTSDLTSDCIIIDDEDEKLGDLELKIESTSADEVIVA